MSNRIESRAGAGYNQVALLANNIKNRPVRSAMAIIVASGSLALAGCGSNPDKGCYTATMISGGTENNILRDMEQRHFDIGSLSGLQATGLTIQNEIFDDYSKKGLKTDHLEGGETAEYCIDGSGHISPGDHITLNQLAIQQAAARRQN